ncbi:MAG: hypothetical protein Q7K57_48575 [Burkholderiaceae bacterium]|nr:hypothetical protein [Burkholderiaceae bacterium]
MTTRKSTDSQLLRAYRKWDEGKVYSKQLKSLTKAQVCGMFACTAFKMYASSPFEWSRTNVIEILETLRKTPWLNDWVEHHMREKGVPLEDILKGIEYFLQMNAEAKTWAQRMLSKYESDNRDDEPLEGNCVVNEWLNETTLEMPELMSVRMDSPLFFGQIYLEFERAVVDAFGNGKTF